MKKSLLILGTVAVIMLTNSFSFAQNLVKFVDGRVISAADDGFKKTKDFITVRIEKSDVDYPIEEVAFIVFQNGEIVYCNYDKEENRVSSPTFDSENPLSTIKKGMSVYVPYGSEKLKQRLCAKYTIDYLINEETFNVVYTPIEAHFTFEVIFDDKKSDNVYFFIKNKDTGQILYKSKKVKTTKVFIVAYIPNLVCEKAINALMKKEYKKFQKKLNSAQ